MPKKYQIIQVLPPGLRSKIEITEHGTDRDEREVAWYYRFLEIGNARGAALDVGYPDDKAGTRASGLKKKFAGLILEGLMFVGQSDLPLAAATLRLVMRTYDPDATIEVTKYDREGNVSETYTAPDPGRAVPGMASAAVKAAESYMDRFGMPKGLKIDLGAGGEGDDFRLLIDRLVAEEGIEAVLRMPTVMAHKEYRDYFEKKMASGEWGPGTVDITDEVIEVAPAPVPAPGDKTDGISDSVALDEGQPDYF